MGGPPLEEDHAVGAGSRSLAVWWVSCVGAFLWHSGDNTLTHTWTKKAFEAPIHIDLSEFRLDEDYETDLFFYCQWNRDHESCIDHSNRHSGELVTRWDPLTFHS